jgi:transcriptional regulator with XRE-family HTH domain
MRSRSTSRISAHSRINQDYYYEYPAAPSVDKLVSLEDEGATLSAKSPDKVDVEVGQRIRVLRNEARVSQTDLARALGVTFQQVQKYEKGVNRVGAGRLTKIAETLNVPVSRLLGSDEEHGATDKGPGGVASPLQLLTAPGALRLLRAYGKLEDGVMRRSIVAVVEGIANRPVGELE